jgi:hypothetical protein
MSNLQINVVDSSSEEVATKCLMEQRGLSSWVDHAAAAEAWERQHAVEWARVDQKLRGIAARRAALDAEEANLLRYADELKLWRAYGFGSLLEYLERVMGYAPHTAAERLRVARAIAELPLITEALERGELAHSAVRELSRVAVPDTEDAWLEAARGKNLREIEALVSGHRPGHLPTDETEPRLHRKKITLEVSPETYDVWRKMHALTAEEHGQRLSDDQLIQSVFRRAYGDSRVGTRVTATAAKKPARPRTRSRSSSVQTASVRGSTAAAETSRLILPWPSAPRATPSTSARSTLSRRSARRPRSRLASVSRYLRVMATAAWYPAAAGTSGSICTTSSIRAAVAATSFATSRPSAICTTGRSTSESS